MLPLREEAKLFCIHLQFLLLAILVEDAAMNWKKIVLYTYFHTSCTLDFALGLHLFFIIVTSMLG